MGNLLSSVLEGLDNNEGIEAVCSIFLERSATKLKHFLSAGIESMLMSK